MKKQLISWVAGLPTIVLGVLVLALAGAQEAEAQPDRLVWSQVWGASPMAHIEEIFMLNENSAWAVGAESGNGAVYELKHLGDRWTVTLKQTFSLNWLNALSAISEDNVWVVGNYGLIAHKTGNDWRVVPNPVPNSNLLTLQMLGDGSEGWAAGYITRRPLNSPAGPLLLHYKDGEWRVDNSITGGLSITGLHFAPGGGWAVNSAGEVWRYQDGAWAKEPQITACVDNPNCFPTFYAVRAINSEEAWAVGSRQALCGICRPMPYAAHREAGRWRAVLPDAGIAGLPGTPGSAYTLKSVTFTDREFGMAAGSLFEMTGGGPVARPLVVNYRSGQWSYVNLPVPYGDLNVISMIDSTHGLAAGHNGLILSYGYGAQPQPTPGAVVTPPPVPTPPELNPAARFPDPHLPDVTYFPLVGHTLRGGFRDHWNRYGGLAQFGYPLTEEFPEASPTDGKTYIVQYFERARFEWHPENRPPYDVLLGLLGHTVTANRKGEPPFQRAPAKTDAGNIYFPETGHNMPAQFAGYWRDHGGLPVYGYPISEAFNEISPTDGKSYLVQYFERNRFEYHPELPEPYRVSLGLLGAEVLRARGWIE